MLVVFYHRGTSSGTVVLLDRNKNLIGSPWFVLAAFTVNRIINSACSLGAVWKNRSP